MSAQLSRRLNLAFVVHDYHRHGGQSRYVVELATRFRHNHEIHVYANTVSDTDTAGIQFHHVPAWRSSALASILSFVVPATLMVGKHDIVHAQGLCGLRHSVATAHFIQPAWHAAQAAFCGRITWRQRLAEWLVAPLERRALVGKGVKRVIAVSNRTAGDIRQHYGRSQGVSVIHHGICADTFHPRLRAACRADLLKQLGLDNNAVLALFAGNLQKGAAAAVETIARVPGVHLLLATASDTNAIMKHAHLLGSADRVHPLGFNKHLEQWLAAADMLLYPTFFDTFGMVIVEAMACGIPVVTTLRAGASDLVQHGETGWLVDDPSNIDGLAEGVRLLVNDSGLRTRMGQKARAVAEKRTWDAVADETMAVYRGLLDEHGW